MIAVLTAVSIVAPAFAESTATYRVTFDAEWSSSTHPGSYPGGAHFSSLIGGVHNDSVRFWELGGIATPGIEIMAETGSASTLFNEVTSAINAGDALEVVTGPGLGAPDSGSTEFDATTAMPLLTLVTMVAPSPDWFVGIDSLSLRDGSGWVDSLVVDLYAYDSGTDAGTGFFSGNSDVTPHDPISDFSVTAPFAGTPRLGTFTLTLLSVVGEPCSAADVTTQGAGAGDPEFGVPDGAVSAADINFFVNAWIIGDTAVADLTTTGAGIGDPGYGTPDGEVTGADIQFYVNLWILGCP